MSFRNKKKIDNPSPETFRKELEGYFQYVLAHKTEDLQFSVMLAGHKEGEGTHMCTMVGGPPPMIARALMELMNVLVEQDPTFAIAFLLNALSNMKATGANVHVLGDGVDLSNFDQTGDADTAKTVEDFLASLRKSDDDDSTDSSPPKGSIH